MAETVESYLQSKGILVRDASSSQLHMACIFCKEQANKRGRLYVRKDNGVYHCKRCDARGHYNSLRRHFGDAPVDLREEESEVSDQSDVNLPLLGVAAEYYHACLLETPEVLDWLHIERGLTDATINKHQLGWGKFGLRQELEKTFSPQEILDSGLVYANHDEVLAGRVTIPYHAGTSVLQIRGRIFNGEGAKYKTPKGGHTLAFNTDAYQGAAKIILTEGEFDALVLEQLGYRAIGIPGATVWQDSWRSYLQDAKRVYICFDRDPAGTEGAAKLAAKIGDRASIVLMPVDEKKNDPTEWIIKKGHTKEDFDQLLQQVDPPSLLKSPRDAFDQWMKHEGNTGRKGLKTGYPQLDYFIQPGLMPGQLAILIARTGIGKTLAVINFMYRMLKEDEQTDLKILFVSLEQTSNEWFERAQRIFKFDYPWATNQDVLDFYDGRLMIVDQNRVTEDELRRTVEDYTTQMGKPGLIVVDYLGYWANAFKGEAKERTTSAIMSLKAFAKEFEVPIIAPHQANRASDHEGIHLGSAKDSSSVEETADFFLSLYRRPPAMSPTTGRKDRGYDPRSKVEEKKTGELNMTLVKSRHGNSNTTIKLANAVLSLSIVPDESFELESRKAKDQLQLNEAGVTPDEWCLGQRARFSTPEMKDPNWREAAEKQIARHPDWETKAREKLDELYRRCHPGRQPGNLCAARTDEDRDAVPDEVRDEPAESGDQPLF